MSGDLACVDYDGRVVWSKNLQEMYGEDTLWHDLGTSPVLTNDYVVVACVQSGPSYVAAFDKRTGEVAWKQDRATDAPNESQQSYTTPVIVSDGQQEFVIVLGADCVTGHDVSDGRELWRIGGLNPEREEFFRSISSPVVSGDLLFAPYARGESLTAIRLTPAGGAASASKLWTKTGVGADVPTPAVSDGRLYVCFDRGELACLDTETGDQVWRRRLERNRTAYSSSPILANGKIYVTREDGTTFVVAAGDEYQLLAKNVLDEKTLATPVFADNRVYIRTFEHLYCIGR